MAKGYETNQERLRQLSLLGKPLARRSGRKCELCESGGVELRPFEVPPASAEPALENTLFVCGDCLQSMDDPGQENPSRWRPLEGAVWSTEPAIQVMAVRILQKLAPKTAWARETLDAIDLEPEIEEWVARAP